MIASIKGTHHAQEPAHKSVTKQGSTEGPLIRSLEKNEDIETKQAPKNSVPEVIIPLLSGEGRGTYPSSAHESRTEPLIVVMSLQALENEIIETV